MKRRFTLHPPLSPLLGQLLVAKFFSLLYRGGNWEKAYYGSIRALLGLPLLAIPQLLGRLTRWQTATAPFGAAIFSPPPLPLALESCEIAMNASVIDEATI